MSAVDDLLDFCQPACTVAMRLYQKFVKFFFGTPNLSTPGGPPYRVAVTDSRLPQNALTNQGVDTHP